MFKMGICDTEANSSTAKKKAERLRVRRQSRWNWLEGLDSISKEKFTFPQVLPSLLLQEDPASLACKVPIVPGPKDVVVLSTTKLGTKRFLVPPGAEFDLTDPYAPPPEYNFLHDPHLNEYLNNPAVRQRLEEKGLITPEGLVKCTVKEFNEYRLWIRKLKLDALDQQLRMKLQVEVEHPEQKIRNTEALEITKQRHQRAKELFEKKQRKKEKDRKRYLRLIEEDEKRVENMKLAQAKKLKEEIAMRNRLRERRKGIFDETQRVHKKIRLKILLKTKKDDEQRQKRIEEMHSENMEKRERRASEMWERKQMFCLEQMDNRRIEKAYDEQQRRKSIYERDCMYENQRRLSTVSTQSFSIENREVAMRHLEEATQFLNRIEEKKHEEIRKWREKLKRTEEREKVLHYYRMKRKKAQSCGTYTRRTSRSRQSVWEIDNVLLRELMHQFTDEERKELDELAFNEEEECTRDEHHEIMGGAAGNVEVIVTDADVNAGDIAPSIMVDNSSWENRDEYDRSHTQQIGHSVAKDGCVNETVAVGQVQLGLEVQVNKRIDVPTTIQEEDCDREDLHEVPTKPSLHAELRAKYVAEEHIDNLGESIGDVEPMSTDADKYTQSIESQEELCEIQTEVMGDGGAMLTGADEGEKHIANQEGDLEIQAQAIENAKAMLAGADRCVECIGSDQKMDENAQEGQMPQQDAYTQYLPALSEETQDSLNLEAVTNDCATSISGEDILPHLEHKEVQTEKLQQSEDKATQPEDAGKPSTDNNKLRVNEQDLPLEHKEVQTDAQEDGDLRPAQDFGSSEHVLPSVQDKRKVSIGTRMSSTHHGSMPLTYYENRTPPTHCVSDADPLDFDRDAHTDKIASGGEEDEVRRLLEDGYENISQIDHLPTVAAMNLESTNAKTASYRDGDEAQLEGQSFRPRSSTMLATEGKGVVSEDRSTPSAFNEIIDDVPDRTLTKEMSSSRTSDTRSGDSLHLPCREKPGSEETKEILIAAKAIVHLALGNATSDISLSAQEIHGTSDTQHISAHRIPSADSKMREIAEVLSKSSIVAETCEEIGEQAKDIARYAIFDAASSLGYNAFEIGEAFRFQSCEHLPDNVDSKYFDFVTEITQKAIVNAAIQLGYSEQDVLEALGDLSSDFSAQILSQSIDSEIAPKAKALSTTEPRFSTHSLKALTSGSASKKNVIATSENTCNKIASSHPSACSNMPKEFPTTAGITQEICFSQSKVDDHKEQFDGRIPRHLSSPVLSERTTSRAFDAHSCHSVSDHLQAQLSPKTSIRLSTTMSHGHVQSDPSPSFHSKDSSLVVTSDLPNISPTCKRKSPTCSLSNISVSSKVLPEKQLSLKPSGTETNQRENLVDRESYHLAFEPSQERISLDASADVVSERLSHKIVSPSTSTNLKKQGSLGSETILGSPPLNGVEPQMDSSTGSSKSISSSLCRESLRRSSLGTLGKGLVSIATRDAASKLGLADIEFADLIPLNPKSKPSSSTDIGGTSRSIYSPISDDTDAYSIIAHNALRNAALCLGYSETEVNEVIGPAIVTRLGDSSEEVACIKSASDSCSAPIAKTTADLAEDKSLVTYGQNLKGSARSVQAMVEAISSKACYNSSNHKSTVPNRALSAHTRLEHESMNAMSAHENNADLPKSSIKSTEAIFDASFVRPSDNTSATIAKDSHRFTQPAHMGKEDDSLPATSEYGSQNGRAQHILEEAKTQQSNTADSPAEILKSSMLVSEDSLLLHELESVCKLIESYETVSHTITQNAFRNAALALGYSLSEIDLVIGPSTVSSRCSVIEHAADKCSDDRSASKLCKAEASLRHQFSSILESNKKESQTEVSYISTFGSDRLCLRKTVGSLRARSEPNALISNIIAHNALRNAALFLGYSENEVDDVIGPAILRRSSSSFEVVGRSWDKRSAETPELDNQANTWKDGSFEANENNLVQHDNSNTRTNEFELAALESKVDLENRVPIDADRFKRDVIIADQVADHGMGQISESEVNNCAGQSSRRTVSQASASLSNTLPSQQSMLLQKIESAFSENETDVALSTVVAHNALRNAALTLGYSENEVDEVVGPAIPCRFDTSFEKSGILKSTDEGSAALTSPFRKEEVTTGTTGVDQTEAFSNQSNAVSSSEFSTQGSSMGASQVQGAISCSTKEFVARKDADDLVASATSTSCTSQAIQQDMSKRIEKESNQEKIQKSESSSKISLTGALQNACMLKKTSSVSKESGTFVQMSNIIAHNALRNAALYLGYSESEVNQVIGPPIARQSSTFENIEHPKSLSFSDPQACTYGIAASICTSDNLGLNSTEHIEEDESSASGTCLNETCQGTEQPTAAEAQETEHSREQPHRPGSLMELQSLFALASVDSRLRQKINSICFESEANVTLGTVITHNALRSAARSLGYSDIEVDEVIGPVIICDFNASSVHVNKCIDVRSVTNNAECIKDLKNYSFKNGEGEGFSYGGDIAFVNADPYAEQFSFNAFAEVNNVIDISGSSLTSTRRSIDEVRRFSETETKSNQNEFLKSKSRSRASLKNVLLNKDSSLLKKIGSVCNEREASVQTGNILAHNALRNAALCLGYSEREINEVIGPAVIRHSDSLEQVEQYRYANDLCTASNAEPIKDSKIGSSIGHFSDRPPICPHADVDAIVSSIAIGDQTSHIVATSNQICKESIAKVGEEESDVCAGKSNDEFRYDDIQEASGNENDSKHQQKKESLVQVSLLNAQVCDHSVSLTRADSVCKEVDTFVRISNIIAHNTLRNAALYLGYSIKEINDVLGPPIVRRSSASFEQVDYSSSTKDLCTETKNAFTKTTEFQRCRGGDKDVGWHKRSLSRIEGSPHYTRVESASSIVSAESMNQSRTDTSSHTFGTKYSLAQDSLTNNNDDEGCPNLPQGDFSCNEGEIYAEKSDSEILEYFTSCFIRSIIHNASLNLGYSHREIAEAFQDDSWKSRSALAFSNDSDNSIEDSNLRVIAYQLVGSVLERAIQIVREEQKIVKKDFDLNKAKSFALKFTAIVLGSAAKRLGYNDDQILAAVEKDITMFKSKGSTIDEPCESQSFENSGVDRQRRESPCRSRHERRESIKGRPATPKPSLEFLAKMKEEEEDDEFQLEADGAAPEDLSCNVPSNAQTRTIGEEIVANKQPPGQMLAHGRVRRPTPFFPQSVQRQIINSICGDTFDTVGEVEEENALSRAEDATPAVNNVSTNESAADTCITQDDVDSKWSESFAEQLNHILEAADKYFLQESSESEARGGDYCTPADATLEKNSADSKHQLDDLNLQRGSSTHTGKEQKLISSSSQADGASSYTEASRSMVSFYENIKSDVFALLKALESQKSTSAGPLRSAQHEDPLSIKIENPIMNFDSDIFANMMLENERSAANSCGVFTSDLDSVFSEMSKLAKSSFEGANEPQSIGCTSSRSSTCSLPPLSSKRSSLVATDIPDPVPVSPSKNASRQTSPFPPIHSPLSGVCSLVSNGVLAAESQRSPNSHGSSVTKASSATSSLPSISTVSFRNASDSKRSAAFMESTIPNCSEDEVKEDANTRYSIPCYTSSSMLNDEEKETVIKTPSEFDLDQSITARVKTNASVKSLEAVNKTPSNVENEATSSKKSIKTKPDLGSLVQRLSRPAHVTERTSDSKNKDISKQEHSSFLPSSAKSAMERLTQFKAKALNNSTSAKSSAIAGEAVTKDRSSSPSAVPEHSSKNMPALQSNQASPLDSKSTRSLGKSHVLSKMSSKGVEDKRSTKEKSDERGKSDRSSQVAASKVTLEASAQSERIKKGSRSHAVEKAISSLSGITSAQSEVEQDKQPSQVNISLSDGNRKSKVDVLPLAPLTLKSTSNKMSSKGPTSSSTAAKEPSMCSTVPASSNKLSNVASTLSKENLKGATNESVKAKLSPHSKHAKSNNSALATKKTSAVAENRTLDRTPSPKYTDEVKSDDGLVLSTRMSGSWTVLDVTAKPHADGNQDSSEQQEQQVPLAINSEYVNATSSQRIRESSHEGGSRKMKKASLISKNAVQEQDSNKTRLTSSKVISTHHGRQQDVGLLAQATTKSSNRLEIQRASFPLSTISVGSAHQQIERPSELHTAASSTDSHHHQRNFLPKSPFVPRPPSTQRENGVHMSMSLRVIRSKQSLASMVNKSRSLGSSPRVISTKDKLCVGRRTSATLHETLPLWLNETLPTTEKDCNKAVIYDLDGNSEVIYATNHSSKSLRTEKNITSSVWLPSTSLVQSGEESGDQKTDPPRRRSSLAVMNPALSQELRKSSNSVSPSGAFNTHDDKVVEKISNAQLMKSFHPLTTNDDTVHQRDTSVSNIFENVVNHDSSA